MKPNPVHLLTLIRDLASPTTPTTAHEVWSRIHAEDWNEFFPTLRNELRTGSVDARRLVIGVLCEQAEQLGNESVPDLSHDFLKLLRHEDRLLRIATIAALPILAINTIPIQHCLREIVCNDEPVIAREALNVLLALDASLIVEIADHLRDPA